jgi:hypothetical protein
MLEGVKQSIEFCTGGRELRNSGTLPSDVRLCPEADNPVERKRMMEIVLLRTCAQSSLIPLAVNTNWWQISPVG